MALASAIEWEVRSTGNANNGAGFKRGASGTDRSQQDAAHATLTTASTINATTTIINVAAGDYTVTAADVGNVLKITGGSATAGYYEITVADTVNNRWTVDRAAGTAGQTVVGSMGGAAISPANVSASYVAGNIIWIKKSGGYTVTATTTFSTSGTSGLPVQIVGYDATRGDNGIAEFGTTTNNVIIFSITGSLIRISNVDVFTFGTPTGTRGISLDGNNTIASHCAASGRFTTAFRLQSVSSKAFDCLAFDLVTSGAAGFQLTTGATLICCRGVNNACLPFSLTAGHCVMVGCISTDNTQSTTDGIQVSSTVGATLINNTIANNARDGIRFTAASSADNSFTLNNLLISNGGYGINSATTNNSLAGTVFSDYNAFYGNTSGARNNMPTGPNDIDLSGSPFNGATDYTLNNTAGAGADCRGSGFPGVMLDLGLTGFLDRGALQHQDSGGGGGLMLYAIE